MIKIIGLITFLSILTFANDLVLSADRFAKEIFQSLQTHNKDLFVKTAIGSKQIYSEQMLIEEPRLSKISKQEREKYIEKVLHYTLLHDMLLNSWNKLYKKGTSAKIVWKDTKIDKIDVRLKKKRGIDFSDIFVTFRYQDKSYVFKIDDCVMIKGNWYITDELKWHGELNSAMEKALRL